MNATLVSGEWAEEDKSLVAWFLSNSDGLPRSRFWLWPSHRVSDPDQYYSSLRADVAAGPLGPRSRNGALQQDLRRLRDLFEGPSLGDHMQSKFFVGSAAEAV